MVIVTGEDWAKNGSTFPAPGDRHYTAYMFNIGYADPGSGHLAPYNEGLFTGGHHG